MDKLKNKISPSMVCTGIASIGEVIKTLEAHGAEYLHVDVMDGDFVPNYALGVDYCKELKKLTSIPFDLHLMITDPERKLDWFPIGEGDFVSVHTESTRHLQRALAAIRAKGAKPMAALNPSTPIYAIENVLDDIDGVLVMTVNPGFSGQRLVESTLKKIAELRRFLDERGYEHIEIEADGNVSFVNAKRMMDAGANIFVAGTSSIFSSDFSLDEGMEKLRKIISN